MELQRSDVNTIESIVHKTGIPYEGIKVELIDHLATMVEYKMQENPKLHFEEALSRVSYNMKETISQIKMAIAKKTIKNLIKHSFDFSNWLTSSTILFFTVVTYMMFLDMGVFGAPITSSFMCITILSFFIMRYRSRHIDVGNNYKLSIQKKFGWVPLVAVGGITFACVLLFISLMQVYYWDYINKIILVPISFSYGLFMKAVLDVTLFNIHNLKEDVELDDIFEYYQPSRFELD